MRTTLDIEDELIEKASELTGVKEKTTLVKLGLEALIARECAERLAELGRDREAIAGYSAEKNHEAVKTAL